MTDSLLLSVANEYGLTSENGLPENLYDTSKLSRNMLSGDVTFVGQKKFA